MKLDLTGRNAIVCGASEGIGKASAILLAEMGANVIVIARNQKNLEEVVKLLPNGGKQNHKFISTDFSDSAKAIEVIRKEASSMRPVSILVNNAGGPQAGPAFSAEPEQFLKAFETHLIMYQRLVQEFVPDMKSLSFGRIINIISISVKQPVDNLGVSNTLRGAVASWSKTLSKELGPFGITVNNVLPGHTMTGRLDSLIEGNALRAGISAEELKERMINDIPVGRFGKPEEVAAAVAFFASEQASFVTGVNLPVDGGYLRCI